MTTLTLQPDGTDGVDTSLDSSTPTTNYGSTVWFASGETGGAIARALIKFDLSSIPAGSTIDDATLSLWVQADVSSNTRTKRVYRVIQAWTEAGANWNTYDGSNAWATAGCGDTTNDREATDIGSASMGASESIGTEIQFTLTAAKIQEMITGGVFTNNGFIIVTDTESADYYQFDSSDGATAGERPKLVINYTSPTGQAAQVIIFA